MDGSPAVGPTAAINDAGQTTTRREQLAQAAEARRTPRSMAYAEQRERLRSAALQLSRIPTWFGVAHAIASSCRGW